MSSTDNILEGLPYQYQELASGDIRILTVLPGNFGDAITVQLSVIKLSNTAVDQQNHGYEALSYAWGSKTRSHRLECTDGSYFAVTESLYLALQYLRYQDRGRHIWADAVCINQADLGERGSQVAIMAEIFRHAICVLVWLGEAQPSDTLAFATLQASDKLAEMLKMEQEESFDLEGVMLQTLSQEPWCHCCKRTISGAAIDEMRSYSAVNDLLTRTWFSRLWVFQEAACARDIEVYSGSHHCSWESLRDFNDPWYSSVAPSDIAVVSLCRYMALRSFSTCAVLRLLVVLGEKQCEEHQDRIFAIRSIARLTHMESLRPDYTITADELYRRLVVECLQDWGGDRADSKPLNRYVGRNGTAGLPLPHASLLLALPSSATHEHDENDTENLPSWVPAFHRLSDRALAKYYDYSWHLGPGFLFCEQPPSDMIWTFKKKGPLPVSAKIKLVPSAPNIIQIVSTRYGSVMKVLDHSETPFAHQFDKDGVGVVETEPLLGNAFRSWIFRCARFIETYGRLNAKDFKELMYCSSLASGFDPDIHEIMMEGMPEKHCSPDAFYDWILREFLEPEREDHLKKLRYYDHFRNLAVVATRDKKQSFGWIPQSSRPGDTVSLFSGCPRPFAIRACEDSTFKLLGDSWLLGVSDSASLDIGEHEQEWISLS